jgi:hypothetical protein
MIKLTETTPPADSELLSDLIEKFADPVGTANRAARMEDALTVATGLIGRVQTALASVDLLSELAKCQGDLRRLLEEAKANAATSEQAKVKLLARLTAFKQAFDNPKRTENS